MLHVSRGSGKQCWGGRCHTTCLWIPWTCTRFADGQLCLRAFYICCTDEGPCDKDDRQKLDDSGREKMHPKRRNDKLKRSRNDRAAPVREHSWIRDTSDRVVEFREEPSIVLCLLVFAFLRDEARTDNGKSEIRGLNGWTARAAFCIKNPRSAESRPGVHVRLQFRRSGLAGRARRSLLGR